MVLDNTDIMNGFLSLIFIIISIFVGLLFFFKYRKYRIKDLIFVGITWIIMSEPWWGHTISLFVAFSTGEGLNIQIIYFISTTFVPIGLVSWIAVYIDFLYRKHKKTILIIAIMGLIIFEIIFQYFLFTNPSIIAIKQSAVDSINQPFILSFFLSVLITFLITGILFANSAIKSNDKESKLKGKILLLAILSYAVGSVWDGVFASTGSLLIVSRIILTISSVFFYYGFFLPNWMKRIILHSNRA